MRSGAGLFVKGWTHMANEHDLVAAVERGARYLDEHAPGWEEKIVLEDLRMKSCLRCIIGQLYGDFFEVFPGARLDDAMTGRKAQEEWEEACLLGFAVDESIDEYDE